jgi:NAD(P)-dependent dehydrogenase (short-subunit alcohol dehydrogenase family)
MLTLTKTKIIGADGQPHSLDVWNFVMDINLSGTFNLTRIACQYLVKVPPEGPDGERGVVIMVASSAAVCSMFGAPLLLRFFFLFFLCPC